MYLYFRLVNILVENGKLGCFHSTIFAKEGIMMMIQNDEIPVDRVCLSLDMMIWDEV